MKLTEEMLNTAMRKAVEAGLLPRHACREDKAGHRELMRFILQATLEADRNQSPGLRRAPERLLGVYRHENRAGIGPAGAPIYR